MSAPPAEPAPQPGETAALDQPNFNAGRAPSSAASVSFGPTPDAPVSDDPPRAFRTDSSAEAPRVSWVETNDASPTLDASHVVSTHGHLDTQAGGADQRPPPEWPPLVSGPATRGRGTVRDEETPRPSRPTAVPEAEVEADPWPELPEMEWPQWHDDLTTILREENRRRRLRAEQAGFSWSGPLS